MHCNATMEPAKEAIAPVTVQVRQWFTDPPITDFNKDSFGGLLEGLLINVQYGKALSAKEANAAVKVQVGGPAHGGGGQKTRKCNTSVILGPHQTLNRSSPPAAACRSPGKAIGNKNHHREPDPQTLNQ
jgi:hypothetical protein